MTDRMCIKGLVLGHDLQPILEGLSSWSIDTFDVNQFILSLFHCKHPGLIKNRITFNEKYSKYVNNLDKKSDEVKLRELLNVNPPCIPEYKSKAIESVCMFIRNAYHILHLNVNDKN